MLIHLDKILGYGAILVALLTLFIKVLKQTRYKKYAVEAELFRATVIDVVSVAKLAKGLSVKADIDNLVKEITSASIPKVDQLLNPDLVQETVSQIGLDYLIGKNEVLGKADTSITIGASASAKQIGAELRAEMKRATLSVKGSGVPGKGIDSAKVAAQVAWNLGGR